MKKKLILIAVIAVGLFACLSLSACEPHSHSLTMVRAKVPTCLTDGNSLYWECSGCDKIFEDADAQKEISLQDVIKPATGHRYDEEWDCNEGYHWHNAICEHKDEIDGKEEHDFKNGETCSTCNYTIDYTKGLSYKAEHDTYTVDGIGDAVGVTDLVIPSVYNGKYVTSIENGAFDNCESLVSLVIPDSVTDINMNAFANCDNLESVTLGNGIVNLGYGAFSDCISLKNIVIPDNLENISSNAFYSCISLESVTIGKSVVSIGLNTFANCNKLETLVLNNTLSEIGDGAFSECSSLKELNIPASVTQIGERAFASCGLENVMIENGLTVIGKNVFRDCENLTSITLPNSVTGIGEYAFYGCSRLEDITLPSGLSSIADRAFYKCTSLKSIIIPAKVVKIGERAFYGCTELSEVTFENTIGWEVSDSEDFDMSEDLWEEDLSDKVVAAMYLVDDYCDFYWAVI